MREELRINGIDNYLKQELKAAALDHVGNENISQFVRFIIADFLAKNKEIKKPDIDFSGKKIRVELKLPEDCLKEIEQLAELKLSTRNYYINSIIFQHLGQSQLYGDEIETLRRSNYQIAKIGTNVNQIAKAFNVLVNQYSPGGKQPKIGKEIASLKKDISAHIRKVLNVLDSKTVQWEVTRGGRKKGKRRSFKK